MNSPNARLPNDMTTQFYSPHDNAGSIPKIERISLTLAEIKRSERVVLVLPGEAKLEVLKRAWQSAGALQTPVVALGEVEVLWCP